MKSAPSTDSTKTPEMSVKYPTAGEVQAFSDRLRLLYEAIKRDNGFKSVAAFRAAIDLDYLARLIEADPVKNIGQWQLVIKVDAPKKSKKKKK